MHLEDFKLTLKHTYKIIQIYSGYDSIFSFTINTNEIIRVDGT